MFPMLKGRQGHHGQNLVGKPLRNVIKLLVVFLILFVLCPISKAQDTASYLNPAWRDSVGNYQGRVEAYHQELYSYDWGMTFGMLPVAGEAYVGKIGTGILYSTARAVSLGLAGVGIVRFAEGKPSFGLNLGMVAVGIVCYIALKLSELSDIRHTVSYKNEELVQQFNIATPDVMPNSIRYPTREWPAWVTSSPPTPPHVDSREAIDKPLPAIQRSE